MNERSWLAWLVKVRVIVISFVLAAELLIVNFTAGAASARVPTRVFITVALVWYTVSAFFVVLLALWNEYKLQAVIQIFTDLAFSTAVVYVTGGIDTFFNFLYPLIIIVASILLPRYWSYLTASISFILFGALVELSYFERIPSFQSSPHGDLITVQMVIATNFCVYLAVAHLSSTLAAKLRLAGLALEDKSDELLSLQALHENVIHSIRSGLITTSLDGRITLLNVPGQKLLERPASAVYGRHISELFSDRLPRLESLSAQGEVRGMTPSGDEKIFGITVTALSVPDRGAIGHVYTFEDHTELRRLEREVRMRDRLAAVGRLAAGIAHEIRNPLASIAGSINVLARIAPFNEEQKVLADIIIRESQRLNSIITDFLVYSREKSYKFARVDLISVLEDALILLENRTHDGKNERRQDNKQGASEQAEDGSKDRELKIIRRFQATEAFAVADSDRVKQLFWNLLENAVRAMSEDGTITVSVQAAGDKWRVGIRDTGEGIDPRQMEKIFEPFQSSFEGGTGLGLAIVYQIAQAHGAKISVQSQVGKGTEFVLEILQAKASEDPSSTPSIGALASHG